MKPGDKVCYKFQGNYEALGYDGNFDPIDAVDYNTVYEVIKVDIHSTWTEIQLRGIVGKFNSVDFETIEDNKNRNLGILSDVISEIGRLSCVITNNLDSLIIKIDQVLLKNNESTSNSSNEGELELHFKNLSFLTITEDERVLFPGDWIQKLNEGVLNPLGVDSSGIIFNPHNWVEILELETQNGISISRKDKKIWPDPKRMVLLASGAVIIVEAESLSLSLNNESIQLYQIEHLKAIWFNYWREYWDLKDKNTPLLIDPMCELIIPTTYNNLRHSLQLILKRGSNDQ
jgi:hypothetical protein